MKAKPAVKNELLLENVLTLHNEDAGATLRIAVDWLGMLKMEVYQPTNQEYKDVMLLFSDEDMQRLITLWKEWGEEDAETN